MRAAVDSRQTYLQPNFSSQERQQDCPLYRIYRRRGREYHGAYHAADRPVPRSEGARLNEQKIREISIRPERECLFYSGDIDTICRHGLAQIFKVLPALGFHVYGESIRICEGLCGRFDYRMFMYDMVTTGRRQVGSTIKPFLLTCYGDGYSP